jgi:3'-phosphoadenosine 5'-phosphosulfate sulfotransferase (PAPS reductase)/FAD synthetase
VIDGQRQKRRKPLFQKEVTEWLEAYECSVERPFFHWKTADILALCRRHGVLNPLYDLGFHRGGCFPCVMARKRDIRLVAEHDPGRIETIALAEQETRSSFFRYSTVPDRFATEPTIRDVVAWASTPGRGEPDTPDRPCMSHFMRCE